MPTRPPRTLRSSAPPVQTRAQWARSNSYDMLMNDPDGWVSDGNHGPVWWLGTDNPDGPYGPGGNYASAQSVVTRATALITGPLTAAPFKVQELGFGGRPLPRPRWVTDPMLTRPDARYTTDVYPEVVQLGRGAFYREWCRAACHAGQGAFLCQMDETGMPLAGTLRNLDSAQLSTERDDNGALHWVLGGAGAYDERAVFDREGYLSLGPVTYRIVVLRNPHSPVNPDTGMSMGVFEMHPDTFRLGGQIASFESGTFRSGIPAGYLQVDQTMNSMTQAQADALKARWMASHGGDRRSIAVLNSFTRFVPIQLSPVDAQLGDAKKLQIASTAFAFGLDPVTLNVSLAGSSTYNNVRDAWTNHRDFGLAPWLTAVQDCLTALLPGTQGIIVDLDKFANPTPKERFDAYKVAIDSGVLTPDECRELEGLGPLPKDEPVPEPELEPSAAPAPVEEQPPTDIRSRRPQPWR